MNEPWRVTLLGGLRAQRGTQVITRFKTQKVAALFAYLAFHLRQAHPREVLIELLWPESDIPTLRNSLSVALSSLRNQFEAPGVPQGTVLRADRFSVGLNPAAVSTDVAEFEQALQAAARAGSSLERAQHLTAAVELYQGPLLPGFYEEWIPTEQERLSGLFLDALGALVSYLEGIGEIHTALSHARRAVAVDPLREEGQQHLIRLLTADGQPGAALRQYKEYERLLEEELGDEPSAALRALFRRIEKESGLSVPPAARRHFPATPAAAAGSGGGPATVTFLLTDIEGSTRLFQQAPEAYSAARERHHALLQQEFARHGGREVKETGDGFIAAFPTAGSALACAISAQKALAEEAWPQPIDGLLVRMAIHTGDVRHGSEEGQYHGIVLHHASRMLTAAHGGQVIVSDTTAGLVQQASMEEGSRLIDLGVYRLRDVAEARHLFQVEYPGMARHDFAPLAAEAGHRASVPPRFTRFFGREREIALLRELLLTPQVRLVTLTGPGGTGKTRLSLEVAERLTEPFAGAVYFVPLGDLIEPSLLAGAVLDSLRIPRASQQEPLEQVVKALSRQPALLVLDNFEHLVEGGAEMVQTLLTRVASLKLLVTSRQLLGLSAEREFLLSPLPVPGTDDTPERLCLYDSVQLFIDRAQQVMPHFQVSNANAAAVAALVAGLEGIPLAIELAAARVGVLTPAQMLAQLSHRFDFLATRKRDVAERQRTLRGAVEWSYRLLVPELQRFFCRLSVFRGGWRVEAAEAVCEEPLALDYLEQLRECSLILPGESSSDALRFRMLETLREYGQERLAESKEGDALRDRHLAHFLQLAEEADTKLQGAEPKVRLDRLESEHDNLRAALEWGLATAGEREAGLRLAVELSTFCNWRGYLNEGREWLERMLKGSGNASPALRGRALQEAGRFALRQGDYEAAQSFGEESLAIQRRLGDQKEIASGLALLGGVAAQQGDYPRARSLYEERLAIQREIGGDREIADTLMDLGMVALTQGDLVEANLLCETALATQQKLGDLRGAAFSLLSLGHILRYQSKYGAARARYEESLAIGRELAAQDIVAYALSDLGVVASKQDDPLAARTLIQESLAIWKESGNKRGVIRCLEGLAQLSWVQGQLLRTARLFGAAEAFRERIHAPLPPVDRPDCDCVPAVQAALGEEAFTAAWAEGRVMGWERAVAYALEE